MRIVSLIKFAAIIGILAGCASPSDTSTDAGLNSQVVLHTEFGNVSLYLYDDTPIHRENFLKLAQAGFFDSLTFSRVLHKFVVQAGDPRSRFGTWEDSLMGPGYDLPAEITEHHVHVRGALAMARRDDDENPDRKSSGSQFYLVTGVPVAESKLDSMEQTASSIRKGKIFLDYEKAKAEESFDGNFQDYLKGHSFAPFKYPEAQRQRYLTVGGAPTLDFKYTVFGQVTEGLDIVLKISRQPATKEGQLLDEIRIDSVSVLVPDLTLVTHRPD